MKLSSYASIIAFYIMAITPAAAAPIIERIGAPLVHPWGMDFLDDSHILVTERGGICIRSTCLMAPARPLPACPRLRPDDRVAC
jgi:hypothetical protein